MHACIPTLAPPAMQARRPVHLCRAQSGLLSTRAKVCALSTLPPPSLRSQAYIFVATASEKQWGAGEGTLRKMLKSFKA